MIEGMLDVAVIAVVDKRIVCGIVVIRSKLKIVMDAEERLVVGVLLLERVSDLLARSSSRVVEEEEERE